MMKEQQIQTAIIKHLQSRGAWVCKIIKASKAGVPDVLACVDGRMVALEVKAPGGRVSELQEYNIEKIIGAGGLAGVVYSVADVEELLQS